MIARCHKFLSIFALTWLGLLAHGQAPETWIFEGLITEADPILAPDLQSGWVLSGSFDLNPLELQSQFTADDRHSGRMTGGVTEAEITVDLYHQVLFEATQQPGLAGFDFQDNAIEENGRDLYGWFFPVGGDLGDTGWSSTWLQIWLMDPQGEMISHLPVKVSPYGIDWQSGWFRITFVDGEGNSAYADGRIELFSPASGVDEQDISPWYAIASDLSRQLFQRDDTIRLLQAELSEVNTRMEGLRKMVDLLVEERSSLQQDNALLREKAAAADPETIRKLAALTAEKSLLESQISDLAGKNDNLQTELQQSEQERKRTLKRLRELEEQVKLSREAAAAPVADESASAAAQAARPAAEDPPPAPRKPSGPTAMQSEAEIAPVRAGLNQRQPNPLQETQPDKKEKSAALPIRRERQIRRWGPRKFR